MKHYGRDSVLTIAQGEIGNREQRRNAVKYNDWYYGRHVEGDEYPWCMVFVQWCFAQAGIPLPYKTASCSALLDWYKQHAPERVHKTPKPGDIVIYKGHTGIYHTASPLGGFWAVEGNYSDKVTRVPRQDSEAVAFINPYPEDSEFPTWARDDMRCLINAGILRGNGEAYNLSDDLLRASVMISRTIKYLKGSEAE